MGIRIVGSGSFLPPRAVGNDELMGYLGVRKPNGDPIPGPWLEAKFGIRERRFDYDFARGRKPRPEEGGLFDSDLAIRAARAALESADRTGRAVDGFIHVSCTPDENDRCMNNLRRMKRELGLRPDADLSHGNLGCAGLAHAFRSAQAKIGSGFADSVVVAASNCCSAQLMRERYVAPSGKTPGDQDRRDAYQWAWLSPAIFGDGAAAVVFTNDAPAGTGLLAVEYETHEDYLLVDYPAGGGLHPATAENADDHLYLMDPKQVERAFITLMPRNVDMLRARTGLVPDNFDRIYIHQANGVLVREFGKQLGIPEERLGMNIHKYANTSAASTLLLLDEDIREGRVGPGSLVLFLWIGAGVGAMNGYAAFRL